MQKVNLVMLKYTLVAITACLAATVYAEGQNAIRQGALPPPGPYMSSRPILSPAPAPAPTTEAVQPQASMGQPYPVQPMVPHRQQMPMQPMYGYNPGMPQQGYRAPMPYGGNVPNRYYYPQPSPWQQPGYGPQPGGWHW